ncbi:MAG: hypothetical protein ACFFAH_14825 [Promethearchaeota archaeon]
MTKEKVANFISSIKKRFTSKPKDSIVLIAIFSLVLVIQILVQWRVITQSYAVPAKDSWGSIGHMWHLMERGYLWRERHSIHYPRGYHFFIVAPILINPDFRFSYLYFKFMGIPLLSFYLFIICVILKKIFRKNYIVLTGLMFVLISNQILSRFCVLISTLIPTLMILISLIIIRSKCPFYLTGFLFQLMFLFNPAIAACYLLVWVFFILLKLISKDDRLRIIIINYGIKPFILIIFLIISFIIHTFVVLNLTLGEFLNAYSWFFGTITLSQDSNLLHLKTILLNLDFSRMLNILIYYIDVIFAFRDFQSRLLSYFLIFTFIGLFLITRKFFEKKSCDLINFGKIALITLIWYYTAEILFSNSQLYVLYYFGWIKSRGVEALTGPVIIFCCFMIKLVIDKARLFTIFLKSKNSSYRRLLNKGGFLKLLRFENIIITILLISVFSTILIHRDVSYYLEFEEEHVETMFYIKDNIPSDSKILVNFYDGTGDALTSLLNTYKVYDWEFSEGENDIIAIKEYIEDKNIEYVLLDLETVSSIELYNFTSDPRFENIYENEIYILFEYDNDQLVNVNLL